MQAQDSQSTAAGSEIDSLDELENRVVEIVEQLRQARDLQRQAQREAEQLRARLASKDRELAHLRASAGSVEEQRGEVRRRIESLLDSVEKLS